QQYLTPQVLSEFTRTQFPLNNNRRGMGFDKPQLVKEADGPTSISVSASSFGHSGFTGVYAWADPKYELVYIFLSNRVYPSADNGKINKLNIRTNIHQVFYEALEKRNKQEYDPLIH
nr:serine hydrolase [Bacteroidales bacterium]